MTNPPNDTSAVISLEALQDLAVFRRLSIESLRHLQAQLNVQRIRGGETLFKQGNDGDRLYVIV